MILGNRGLIKWAGLFLIEKPIRKAKGLLHFLDGESYPVMNDLRYCQVEAQMRNKQNLYLTFQYVMLPMGAFPAGQQ